MDINKYLILIKNKDRTEQVAFYNYYHGKWQVRFRNSSKVYTYNNHNFDCYTNPDRLEAGTHLVYANNQPIHGVKLILNFGIYTRLVFTNGFHKIYPSSALTIEQADLPDSTANNCLKYFETIANQLELKIEGEVSFLGKQYKELSVSPKSVLSSYIQKKPLVSDEIEPQLIFPFGFNASQKSAAEKATREQVSVIEGPPGTGKTQTILNIIANAVLNQKTVAVVSNNNSATANVFEKLQEYGFDFIAASLGKKENREVFFADQNGTYPDMSQWQLEESIYQDIKQNLLQAHNKLNEMLEYKNKEAKLKQELSQLQTEARYFDEYYQSSGYQPLKLRSFYRLNADKVLRLLIRYKNSYQSGTISLGSKLYNLIFHGIYSFGIYKHSPNDVISFLQKTYYESKIRELRDEIGKLQKKLETFDFGQAMKKYTEDSMKLFKASLVSKYGSDRNRKVFEAEEIRKEKSFDKFIKEYPVILSTTHSLRHCAYKNYLFDYVLIDEASQVDLVSGVLALSCAKKVVIVGDLKQLPNVIPEREREVATQIFHSYELDHSYNYAEHSLLSSILHLYPDVPRTLLKEHYRCHPKIIQFCNQKFYNDELIVLTEEHENDRPLEVHITAKGNHARGTFNQRQIDVVLKEILPNEDQKKDYESIGIITPFRLQADKFAENVNGQTIEADTVHKFQGREKDIIILSTVSNKIKENDFVDNPNLINVAVSRAVKKLIVVVADGSEQWYGTNIRDLVRYIKYNNFDVIESQVYSVFDLLYSSYSEKLLEWLKNKKRVSKYESENLMAAVIEKVLAEDEFNDLRYVVHQPLRMLIKDASKLTPDERRYALNVLTHTDFVIFNKFDKMPVLVVEVDGHHYHANNPTQLKRDEMKDHILKKQGIPFIRMKTTGSDEESILREKLLALSRHTV